MSSLEKIQRIVKIIRAVTIVVFALDIVAMILCIPGLILLLGEGQLFSYVYQLVNALAENSSIIGKETMYAALFVLFVNCLSGAVLCFSLLSFFKKEMEVGMPFTYECADRIFRLGLLFILLPICTQAVCSLGLSIGECFYPKIERVTMGDFSTGIAGLMLLLLSLLCRGAAEMQGQRSAVLE